MNELKEKENQMQNVRIWNNQRVVTFSDIDAVHQRAKGTARRNFNANKKYFLEDEDFCIITRENPNVRISYIENINIPPKGITVLTETGYLMIAKSFTDDLSWQVQRQLVNNYFRQKQDEPIALTELDKYKVSVSGTWFDRNKWKIKLILDTYNFDRKYLYHSIKT